MIKRHTLLSAFDNYFLQAQRVRQLVRNDFNNIFSLPNFYFTDVSPITQQPLESTKQVDVLIHPSAIRTAPEVEPDGKGLPVPKLDSYVQDVLTVPASLAGLPALSVPIPAKFLDPDGDGWPIGVSVVGQWGADELVMKVGEVVQEMNS